jgi:hypothetical protein
MRPINRRISEQWLPVVVEAYPSLKRDIIDGHGHGTSFQAVHALECQHGQLGQHTACLYAIFSNLLVDTPQFPREGSLVSVL